MDFKKARKNLFFKKLNSAEKQNIIDKDNKQKNTYVIQVFIFLTVIGVISFLVFVFFMTSNLKRNDLFRSIINSSFYKSTESRITQYNSDKKYNNNTNDDDNDNENEKQKVHVFYDPEQKISISTNNEWFETEKVNYSDASILLSSKDQTRYIVVICENKENFDINIKHKDYRDMLINQIREKHPSLMGTSEEVKFSLDGNEAIQNDFLANVDGANIKYILTTIDTSDTFIQIVAWTFENVFNDYRSEFVEIVNSFKYINSNK